MNHVLDLYRAATDEERIVLTNLRLRAGHIWKCAECLTLNLSEVNACDECNVARPQ